MKLEEKLSDERDENTRLRESIDNEINKVHVDKVASINSIKDSLEQKGLVNLQLEEDHNAIERHLELQTLSREKADLIN